MTGCVLTSLLVRLDVLSPRDLWLNYVAVWEVCFILLCFAAVFCCVLLCFVVFCCVLLCFFCSFGCSFFKGFVVELCCCLGGLFHSLVLYCCVLLCFIVFVLFFCSFGRSFSKGFVVNYVAVWRFCWVLLGLFVWFGSKTIFYWIFPIFSYPPIIQSNIH